MDEEIERQIALLESTDWEVRRTAMEALIEIGAPAVPAVIQALLDRQNLYRLFAAEALGKMGNTSAIPALVEVLNDGDNYGIDRQYSAEALGRIGDASVIPVLIQALRDRESQVRLSAARALHVIAIYQPTVKLRGAIPVLKRLIIQGYLTLEQTYRLDNYNRALEAIEEATQGREDLPIAASASVHPAEGLPIAVEEAPSN